VFFGTDLEVRFSAQGVDSLIMVGIASTGVVLSSVAYASDADFRLFTVKDCCYDPDQVVHDHLFSTAFDSRTTVLSLADALLLLAEALNEEGRAGDALVPLNKVRSRAGLAAATTTDQGELRTAIWHERRVELAFEDCRWEDLLRFGTALDVINAFGVKIRQELSYLPPDSHVVTTHNLLFPIPQDNIDLNPKLTQNP